MESIPFSFPDCIAVLDFPGAGPLTDVCAWEDGRFVVVAKAAYLYAIIIEIYLTL